MFFSFKASKDVKAEAVNTKNWYIDRYESVIIQRNIIFVFCLVCVLAVFVSLFFISELTLHKSVQPMVIEVEESTGITDIVNPLIDRAWTENKVMNEYFLMKYIKARETYDVSSYLYRYNTLVRLMSSVQVYEQFKQYINDLTVSPIVRYGADNSTILKIRSIQFLPDTANGKNVQVRFAVIETQGTNKIVNKIASIVFSYVTMSLTFEERLINPLGFQIISYSVADEKDI